MNVLDEILAELKAIRSILDSRYKNAKPERKVICPTLIVLYDKPIEGQPLDGLSVRAINVLSCLRHTKRNLSELNGRDVQMIRGCGWNTAAEIVRWAMERGAKP